MLIEIYDIDTKNMKIYESMNKLYKDFDFEWKDVKGHLYNGDGTCKNDMIFDFLAKDRYKIKITILN